MLCNESRLNRTVHAGVVLDALEKARHARWSIKGYGLAHYSDRCVQYVSINYFE